MKIIRKILFIIVIMFVLITKVQASSKQLVFLTNTNIRKGPSTNYTIYITGSAGSIYDLLSDNIVPDELNNGNCNSGWYKLNYNNTEAYVCSEFVKVEEKVDTPIGSTACEVEMKEKGFPDSYWKSLCLLKEKHPNWEFNAIDTKLDFSLATDSLTSCGDSLVSNPKSEWIDKSCSYKEGSFVTVNQTGVAFYLDPRNFLTENYIFQFEDSKFNASLENNYTDASRTIIKNAQFYKYHMNLNNDLAAYLSQGGKETNVNSVHLASRMYQELGATSYLKNLYQGTFAGSASYFPTNTDGTKYYDFRNLYNFYNIGVTSTCVLGPGSTYCGLTYAKNANWNTVYAAVKGGGTFLTNNYINGGQYTSYFERFNVVPVKETSRYIHYYMANLQGPSSEALTAYNTYKENNLLDSAFKFYIPVYSNMDVPINNNNTGASGDIDSPSAPSTTEIPTMITSAGYKISEGYFMGITPGEKVATIKNKLGSITGTGNVSINLNDNNIITTGTKITIKNSNEEKTYIVVIKGDTSGDGIINAKDLLEIQRNILGNYNLDGAFKSAADTSKDGVINAKDLLEVQRHILGNYVISQ